MKITRVKLLDAVSNVVGGVILNHIAIAIRCGCGGYHISNIAAVIVVAEMRTIIKTMVGTF